MRSKRLALVAAVAVGVLVVGGVVWLASRPSEAELRVAHELRAIRHRADPNILAWNESQPVVETLAGLGPAAVPALVKALGDKDWGVRSVAQLSLARMGQTALPALTGAFHSRDQRVRDGALEALGLLAEREHQAGSDALAPLVPELVAMLRDSSRPSSADAAARVLWCMGESAAPALEEVLDSTDPVARQRAANALAGIAPYADVAGPALLKCLTDEEPAVRREGLLGLGNMGVKAGPMAPQIAQCLADSDAEVRRHAVSALASMGKAAKVAVPDLIRCMDDDSIAADAARALGSIGVTAPEVEEALKLALKHSDEAVRASSAQSLALLGYYDAALPALRQAVAGSDAKLRSRAVSILGEMGPAARSALPELLRALEDQDANVRASAARAVGRFGRFAGSAVPALVALLADASSAFIQAPSDGPSTSLPAVVRHEAARALGRVATTAPPELMELLAQDDEATAAYASIALGRIGAPAAQPVAERLRETDPKVRRRALSALYAMGPKAGGAVPALVQSLSDPDEEFRKSVLATLSALGPSAESAMPTLVSKLGGSPSARELQATTRAIGDIGRPREKAVAALIGCVSTGDPVTRDIACDVLGKLGDSAAIPGLRQRLEDEADWVRLSAADALMRLGKRDVGQPVVLDWLRTKDRLLQDAARALAEAGDDSDEVLSVLTELLHHEDTYVRAIAAGGLARRGMEAQSAVPALLACLEDDDAQTRATAAAALVRMGRRSEALPVLMACLDCSNEMGRRTAIEAAGQLKETSAVPRLRALAFRENDDRMVDAIERALAAMGEGAG